jgi:hypothetical protein
MAGLDFSNRAAPPEDGGLDFTSRSTPPRRKRSLGDEIAGAVTGAVDRLKTDAKGYYDSEAGFMKRGKPLSWGEQFGQTAKFGGLIGDTLGVAAAPVAGLIHGAIVKPAAGALDVITPNSVPVYQGGQFSRRVITPEQKHDINEGLISGALNAARAPGLIKAAAPSRAAGMLERFDQAGVRPMLAAAGGKGSAGLTNTVAENPIAGIAARGRLRGAVADTEASAADLARKYGETRGPQITGENVQAGVTRFARDRRDPTSFATKAGARYDAAFADIDASMAGKTQPGASQIETPATTAALQQINASTQSAAIGELVADPTLSKVARTLSDARAAKDMSFADLRRLRTWVRDAQKDPELRAKIGPANLSRLEGTLTQDIYGNAAKLASPEAAAKLRRADQYYAAGQARIENALQSFADARSGENAYNRVLQAAGSTGTADAQKLLSLKRSLAPDEWGDVSSNVISEMGRPTPGQAGAAEPGFSVARFVTRYNQLSPRGRDILFGAVGGGGKKASALRAELDNLASVADDLKNLEKGANTSKTAVSAQSVATLGGLVTPHAALPTAGILSSMALTGEVMTNPTLVRWMVRLGRAQKTSPAAVTAVVKQLKTASQANAALMPVYQQSLKLLPSQPLAATAAAEDQTPR